jgi:NitT/TauT family transport system substrate-binding protein
MAVDEAHGALAGGEVDAVVGPLDASFFDGAHGGSGARWVMGGTIPRAPHDFDAPQAGLWMHSGVIDDRQRWADIENHTLALPGGIESVTVLPVGRALDQGESSLNAVDIRDALLVGEVTAAWIPAGGVERVAGADGIELMITYPAGEPLDGTVMSADLLGAERGAAAAYARAVIRTINTHLVGAVEGELDERVLTVVDEVLAPAGQTPEGPAVPLCDWEIRSGTTDRIQAEYSELGSVAYEGVLPESEVVDRSLVAEVIDAAG